MLLLLCLDITQAEVNLTKRLHHIIITSSSISDGNWKPNYWENLNQNIKVIINNNLLIWFFQENYEKSPNNPTLATCSNCSENVTIIYHSYVKTDLYTCNRHDE